MGTSTAQLYSTKPELKLCVGSNPAHEMSKICDGENMTIGPVGNKS